MSVAPTSVVVTINFGNNKKKTKIDLKSKLK